MSLLEEVEHPETGVLHLLEADTSDQLADQIADLLADVVDLTPRGRRERRAA